MEKSVCYLIYMSAAKNKWSWMQGDISGDTGAEGEEAAKSI